MKTWAEFCELIGRYVACKGTYPHRWGIAYSHDAIMCERCRYVMDSEHVFRLSQVPEGGVLFETPFDIHRKLYPGLKRGQNYGSTCNPEPSSARVDNGPPLVAHVGHGNAGEGVLELPQHVLELLRRNPPTFDHVFSIGERVFNVVKRHGDNWFSIIERLPEVQPHAMVAVQGAKEAKPRHLPAAYLRGVRQPVRVELQQRHHAPEARGLEGCGPEGQPEDVPEEA